MSIGVLIVLSLTALLCFVLGALVGGGVPHAFADRIRRGPHEPGR